MITKMQLQVSLVPYCQTHWCCRAGRVCSWAPLFSVWSRGSTTIQVQTETAESSRESYTPPLWQDEQQNIVKIQIRSSERQLWGGSAVPAVGGSSGLSVAHWSAAGRLLQWGVGCRWSFNQYMVSSFLTHGRWCWQTGRSRFGFYMERESERKISASSICSSIFTSALKKLLNYIYII